MVSYSRYGRHSYWFFFSLSISLSLSLSFYFGSSIAGVEIESGIEILCWHTPNINRVLFMISSHLANSWNEFLRVESSFSRNALIPVTLDGWRIPLPFSVSFLRFSFLFFSFRFPFFFKVTIFDFGHFGFVIDWFRNWFWNYAMIWRVDLWFSGEQMLELSGRKGRVKESTSFEICYSLVWIKRCA